MTGDQQPIPAIAPEIATSRIWSALYEARTTGKPATEHVGGLVVALEQAAPSDPLWADQLEKIVGYAAEHDILLPQDIPEIGEIS